MSDRAPASYATTFSPHDSASAAVPEALRQHSCNLDVAQVMFGWAARIREILECRKDEHVSRSVTGRKLS
jgi:hypothetical protein